MRISSRKLNKIKFNPDHTNYEDKYGNYVPSVTTILKVLSKGDSLLAWSNNLGWRHKSYKKELEDTSIIGTTAHAFCEYMMSKDEELLSQIENRMKNFPEELYMQTYNAINSFKKWYLKNKNKIEVISTELQLSCDKYGGTTDLVCKYNDKLILLDYKTSSSFYMSQFLQLAAYAKMYKLQFDKEIEDIAVLKLDKKEGKTAKLLLLSDLPNGDIKYYQFIFDKIANLYYYNHVLENDWDFYKKIINTL